MEINQKPSQNEMIILLMNSQLLHRHRFIIWPMLLGLESVDEHFTFQGDKQAPLGLGSFIMEAAMKIDTF